MNDADRTVSPSELATYVECPRRYEYQHDQGIESPPDGERYKNRGTAYHETIAAVCDDTSDEDSKDDILEIARETFEETWYRVCSPEDYKTRSHYEYDRKLTLSGIEAYFDGPGVEHARNSIATELTIQAEYKHSNVGGRIDNVVKTGEELLLIDYKGNLRNIITSRTSEHLGKHLNGETYRPKLVKSAVQAAVYLEGIRETGLYEDGMDTSFVYYGILDDYDTVSTADGVTPQVAGKARDVTNVCMDNHGTIWQLIREAYQGILAWNFEPEPWPEIYQSACDDCPYEEMCPDFLAEEVKVE